MNKPMLCALLLTLSACGSGSTYTSEVMQRPERCFELEMQCRFSDNAEGCRAVKSTKQTAEQGAEDDDFYAAFCGAGA